MSVRPHTGGCACGSVRYRAEGRRRPIVACSCETCRTTSGHHLAAASALRASVTVEGEVRRYRASKLARRGFCPVCGPHLFRDGQGETLSIFAATRDGPTGLGIAAHIFCAEEGNHHDIPEGVRQASDPWPG